MLGGFSLWVYVALAFLLTGLVLPMITTAPILLYGDAAARDGEHSPESDDASASEARALSR
jgi:hypothetical protein